MTLALVLSLALAATSNSDALSAASDHLSKGRLDEVLFTLEGRSWSASEAKQAAALLARAGSASLTANDALMALQFAQTAIRVLPADALAHEVAARAYRDQQQFGPAEEHADKWIALSLQAEDARLFRAQLALEQGDWALSLDLAEGLEGADLTATQQVQARAIRAQAGKEMKERRIGRSTARALEVKLEKALESAKRLEARRDSAATTVASAKPGVVLYSTKWCGYCTKARQFLQARKVPFVERDIEKEAGAREELAAKAAKLGIRPRGVPVIDVGGQLVLGWDPKRLDQLLSK